MRIGLYGLPGAGKSHLLEQIDFMRVIQGSVTMKKMFPQFDLLDEDEKNAVRKQFAEYLGKEKDFLMDGHYSFGDQVVFTESDGELYDVFLYLFISPQVLENRMRSSEKNYRYLEFDIEQWQKSEIYALREYCHQKDKDFYVIDQPEEGFFQELSPVVNFIRDISQGYSCVKFAGKCTEKILQKSGDKDIIVLTDGDKTISMEDTSRQLYGYTTNIFDNNFYTGYQSWMHGRNFEDNYGHRKNIHMGEKAEGLKMNTGIIERLHKDTYILTSGDKDIWETIAHRWNWQCFYGNAMSADAKYFIAKNLRRAGKYVIAYGDSINDYYMLKEADEGFLVAKADGSISRSLKGMDLGGICIV